MEEVAIKTIASSEYSIFDYFPSRRKIIKLWDPLLRLLSEDVPALPMDNYLLCQFVLAVEFILLVPIRGFWAKPTKALQVFIHPFSRRDIRLTKVFLYYDFLILTSSLYGKDLNITKNILTDAEGNYRSRTTSFKGFKELKRLAALRNPNMDSSFDPFKIRTFWRTTFKLYSFCVICGCESNIEMHHIKSLKNIKKLPLKSRGSFNSILKQLNRKQVPVCKKCHTDITSGRYSGTSLKDLFSESLAAL